MEFDIPENLSLAKLPPRRELALYLIKIELRNRKFFSGLEDMGLDTSFLSYDLSSLILNLVGFEIRTDQDFEWYNQLLEKKLSEIALRETEHQLTEIAFNFLLDLELEKRNRR
jgi:hypothetical protein